MEKNQILLEISKDKKNITITLGDFQSMSFECCPMKPTKNIQKAIEAYLEKTGLENLEEWENSKCYYKDGIGCSECN